MKKIILISILFVCALCSVAYPVQPDSDCCVGIRGNINGDASDEIDISDVVYLVDYMFNDGAPIPCPEEADISPILSPDGSVDIADLVAIIDYMFNDGSAPPECAVLISIMNLQPGDNIVNGTALVSDTSIYKVVLYAKTNKWYVQPSVIEPYTIIQSNGSWSNSTYPWDRMIALLVDASYTPEDTKDYHPSIDPGVIDWDEYPEKADPRSINWSGYNWQVKTGDLVGPGPNYFSDDTLNVWIDQQGRLHEKIEFRDNKWYCSEIVLDHSLGYGLYRVKLDSRVDSLDYNTIFSPFIYETIDEEFDIEFSQRLAAPYNAQYVAQPWYTPGNITFFDMPSIEQSTHTFEWRSDRIIFMSWEGHADSPTGPTLINSWAYTGDDIPIPGNENMIFNLYLYGGKAPTGGVGDEVIIKSFEFIE